MTANDTHDDDAPYDRDADEIERASLISYKSVNPSPTTLTKLVKRLRALTLTLLPVEVKPESIKEPTSRIITAEVIKAYEAAAGDFGEALPYCLLRARRTFLKDANNNPADFDENMGRAVACEVLARRIVHRAPQERLNSIMSTRYRYNESGREEGDFTSALELAIDTHCTIFLSSNEAQYVVNSLWKGYWVQKNNADNDIDYVPYDENYGRTFWDHLDPSRLCVPRYQSIFRIAIWIFFLIVYSQAVREPLERIDSDYQSLEGWEIVLYVMALAFALEDVHKTYKTLRVFTWRAFSFWTIVSLITDALLITAFTLRVSGLYLSENEANRYHFRSFQVLSFVSPFIWMKLLTVVDGYKYIGTMQICVARMLQESGIFFALLSILGIGFAQGLYALDAADGETEHGYTVINALVQALLQSPDFDRPAASGAGLLLYYLWNVATTVILLNVLISLFSSAYDDVVDDAEAQYLAFFAGKTVGMIRAPDSFVYPAPFNLIEVFLVAPFEPFISSKAYAKLNRIVMTILFLIPLAWIALWETRLPRQNGGYATSWIGSTSDDDDEAESPSNRNPEADEDGKVISKVPFEELVKVFPNVHMSGEANILAEIRDLKAQINNLMQRIHENQGRV